jgi:NAD-dependent deacetylase
MHPPVSTYELEPALEQAAGLLRQAESVAVLTGAGISAESGVPTFRGAGGLWEGHSIDEVATPMAFEENPELVWGFYNARRANLRTVQPNPGHRTLAAMEARWGSTRFALITQNVDGLHRVAGSQRVLELHGNLARVRCTACDLIEDRGYQALPEMPHCDRCGALLRPDVVWFYEMLPQDVWRESTHAVEACQCLMVVGTSAIVYPAASLIDFARGAGAGVIEVNLEATAASQQGGVGLYGPAGEILPRLFRLLS